MSDQGAKNTLFLRKKPLLIFLIVIVLAVLIILISIFRYIIPFHDRAQNYDLSLIDDVERPSLILDRNGKEIGRMFVENRSVVSFEEMPETLKQCVIAQEDQRFWDHEGVDWQGVGRMFYLLVKQRKVTQGASTLTMQLARNAFNLKSEAIERGESGTERKIVEIFLALRIGDEFSGRTGKNYILANYLNRVPFGHGFYGIRSAALGYYGKEPKDLALHEAASIIACIKNPYHISPLRNPERNKKERNHVFVRLHAEGKISSAEKERLLALPIRTNSKPLKRGTSYIYEKIADFAREEIGEEAMSQGGYTIHTTIDADLQKSGEEQLKKQLAQIEGEENYDFPKYADFKRDSRERPKYLQGALLSVQPQSGEVLAYVGGRDFSHSQYDFIASGKKPWGTAILPFLYLNALDEGYCPSSLILDETMDNRLVMVGGRQGILGEWGMETLYPEYEGEITLRHALEESKIAASVRLGKEIGLESFSKFMKSLGLVFPADDKLLPRDYLGWVPVSLTEAVKSYSLFPAGGKQYEKLSFVNKIIDSSEEVIFEKERSEASKESVDASSAFQVHSMLKGVLKNGNLRDSSQKLLESGFDGGGKTGTFFNFSDSWSFAYNAEVVSGVWVGFHQGNTEPILQNGFSKSISWPIQSNFFSQLPARYKEKTIEPVKSLKSLGICKSSGLLATRYCFTEDEGDVFSSTAMNEWFKPENIIKERCDVHTNQSVTKGEKNSLTSILDSFAPKENVNAAKPILDVDPVKILGNAIVGKDPYKSLEGNQKQVEDEPEEAKGVFSSNQLILNDNIFGEEELMIQLPLPNKLTLKFDPATIRPESDPIAVIEE